MSKITAILGSALFFFVAPAMLAGVIPWLITHWEFRPPFFARSDTLGWVRVHYCRRAWIVRFVCALCVGGSGYACADRATTQSRGERIISLCAQSDLCCSRCRHSWSGGVIR